MMVWDGHDWGWGGWLLMSLSMVVFWGLVIGLLIAFLRTSGASGQDESAEGHGRDGVSGGSAEQILARRYARGEIDEAEYHRRLDVLRGHHDPTDLTKAG
jgi:putative membrane protein